MLIRTKFDPASKAYRVLHEGKDLARVENNLPVYDQKVALQVAHGINALTRVEQELAETRTALARYQAKPKDLKAIDLTKVSRNSLGVYSTIQLESSALREAFNWTDRKGMPRQSHWLTFGNCEISTDGPTILKSRMRDGITDYEHSTCCVIYIWLIGLQYKFTHGASYFEAYITPDIENIRIYDESFVPEKAEGAEKCKCVSREPAHLVLPKYTPPVYKYARLVAGQKVSISTGPNFGSLEKLERLAKKVKRT